MSRTLDAARGELGLFARASTIAIVILAVAAAALILLRARARAGAAAPDPAPSPARVGTADADRGRGGDHPCCAAAGSGAASSGGERHAMASRSYRARGWASAEPPTPDLVGPDEIERAPVVEVHKDRDRS